MAKKNSFGGWGEFLFGVVGLAFMIADIIAEEKEKKARASSPPANPFPVPEPRSTGEDDPLDAGDLYLIGMCKGRK